eukprot:2312179-Rhodomonas_salina.1
MSMRPGRSVPHVSTGHRIAAQRTSGAGTSEDGWADEVVEQDGTHDQLRPQRLRQSQASPSKDVPRRVEEHMRVPDMAKQDMCEHGTRVGERE